MRVAFVVPGSALPWQRARRGKGRTYTSAEQVTYQDALRWHALAARPRGWSRAGKYVVSISVRWPDARRRDLDNAQKQVGDALNTILWDDDAFIVGWVSVIGPTVDASEARLTVLVESVSPEWQSEGAARVEGLAVAEAALRQAQGVGLAERKRHG